VDVTVRRDDADNAVIEIRDTGIGLSAEDDVHVTERFYRGRTARRMFPSGSGLGLAIAKRIATLHRGTLELSPRDGGGTVASVKLPVVS
jgi:two-component system, OmpR family, phosphate regulon sensor histidine kinase PhoR